MDYHYQRFILPTSSDNCPIFTNDWRQTGGDLNNTTGFSFFAECLRHSAKADIHSAKPLPSVSYTRQMVLGKQIIGKAFAEC